MRANEQDNQLIWETLKEAGDWPKMGPRKAGDDFDMAGQTGLGPLDDKPDPELSRVPPGKGLDKPTEPMSDEEGNSRKLEVGDFEKELVDFPDGLVRSRISVFGYENGVLFGQGDDCGALGHVGQ